MGGVFSGDAAQRAQAAAGVPYSGGQLPMPSPGKPEPPPTVPKYKAPDLYANRIAPEQRDIRNVQSTSHQYLSRFGASGEHF